MLDDGSDCFNWEGICRSAGYRDIFLIADSEITFSDCHESCSGSFRRFDDIDFESFFGIIALIQGYKHAGMIGVGHIV